MIIKNNNKVPNICFRPSKLCIKEVCSKMQCLQPVNHSKRRRYWQLHRRMPGALLPWELLQMRGRQLMSSVAYKPTDNTDVAKNANVHCVSCRSVSSSFLRNQMNMAAILWTGGCFARPVISVWFLASSNKKQTTPNKQKKNFFFHIIQ